MTSQQVGQQASQPNLPGLATTQGKLHLLFLIFILISYAILSLYQIGLPGLHYDEAFEAVPALQLLLGQPVTAFRDSGITVGGQMFPLMTQDYIGALNTYVAIPFIAIFGATPAALRVMSVLIGVVTLWLTYLLTCYLTRNRRAGLAAALILAVDPTFVFWNRQGIFVTAITATIGVAATLCWLRRWQTGKTGWAVAGAFLFGLGLYAKFLFLWLIAALIGAIFVLNLSWLIKSRAAVCKLMANQKADIAFVGVAFLLGCWPLLAYNAQTAGTFLSVTENAATSYYGVNNLALGSNLIERLGQFVIVLNGSHFWYLGKIITNPLSPLTFGLVLLGVVVFMAIRRTPAISNRSGMPTSLPQPNPQKVVLFPFLVIGLVILFSIGTVSALWVTHFAVLMPWPSMAIAIGGWYLHLVFQPFTIQVGRLTFHISRSRFITITWIGLGLLLVFNLVSVIRYHRALTESGGLSSHSDAVYDLSDWLAGQPASQVVAMDWGLAAPVTYLTNGQVSPTEIFGYAWQPNPDLTARLGSFIAKPSTLYLWRSPDEIIFDRSQEFKTIYRPLNLEEDIEAAFYERSGRPILGVTRLVEKDTASNPPK